MMSSLLGAVVIGFAWIGAGVVVGSIVGYVMDRRRRGREDEGGVTLVIIGSEDEDMDEDEIDRLIAECGGVPPKEAA